MDGHDWSANEVKSLENLVRREFDRLDKAGDKEGLVKFLITIEQDPRTVEILKLSQTDPYDREDLKAASPQVLSAMVSFNRLIARARGAAEEGFLNGGGDWDAMINRRDEELQARAAKLVDPGQGTPLGFEALAPRSGNRK